MGYNANQPFQVGVSSVGKGEAPEAKITKTYEIARLTQSRYEQARQQRMILERRMLRAMANFNNTSYGGVPTDQLPLPSVDNGEPLFIGITQLKTMAAYSRIMAIMQGPTGFPWDLGPTPIPDMVALSNVGVETSPQYADVLSKAMKDEVIDAETRAQGMKTKLQDYLVETEFDEKFAGFLLDFVMLGTGIFKGPTLAPRKPSKWMLVTKQEETAGGGFLDGLKGLLGVGPAKVEAEVQEWKLVQPDDDDRPEIHVVSPFEFYPDPAAYSVNQCMWIVQRHVLNRHELMELAARDDFDADEIEEVLVQFPKGNWSAEPWESTIDAMNKRNQSQAQGERFIALEMWTYMTNAELQKAGVEIPDVGGRRSHLVCVWTIGNCAIKIAASVMQDQRLPFFVAQYEKIPYSIFGRGVPEKMFDPQDILNASTRAMVDNQAITAGPQVVVDQSRLVDGFQVDKIQPWTVWPIKNMEGATQDPVKFLDVPSKLAELKVVQDIFRAFIQEVTSMPDMTSGLAAAGQHNRTSSGMSMLFNAADTYTRGVVFNLDNQLTKPLVRRLYDFAMQFCHDESIKGDYSVEAKGVQGLLQNEQMAMMLTQLGPMFSSPEFAPWINKPEMVKEILRSMKIYNTSIVYSEEEAVARMEAMAQSEAQREVGKAGAIAQAQENAKLKAETTPRDAILQLVQDATKSETLEPALPDLFEQAVLMHGFMTPHLQQTIEAIKEHSDVRMAMDAEANTFGGIAPEQQAPEPVPEKPEPRTINQPMHFNINMPEPKKMKRRMNIVRDENGNVISLEPMDMDDQQGMMQEGMGEP